MFPNIVNKDVHCSTDSKDTQVAIQVVNTSSTTQVTTSHSSINDSGIDESEELIGITSHSDSTSNYFDSLEECPDPLDYNDSTPGTCSVEFDEATVTSDSIMSNYLEIEWEHYIISKAQPVRYLPELGLVLSFLCYCPSS